jgi:hypothetical protein
MLQALGVHPHVIDRCQNHVMAGSRVRRHYLTHRYAHEKQEAWARLGEAIETILETSLAPIQRGVDARVRAPNERYKTKKAFTSEVRGALSSGQPHVQHQTASSA